MRFAWLVLLVAVLGAGCSPPPPGLTVTIGDDVWAAEPSTMSIGGDEFSVTVANESDSTESFVMLRYWGEPSALPVVDGEVEVRRNGLKGGGDDPWNCVPCPRDVALFAILYPPNPDGSGAGEGEVPNPQVPELVEPGALTTFTIGNELKGGGGPGSYMILSWEPGEYESGAYVTFEITR
jgi:hypothetical protein